MDHLEQTTTLTEKLTQLAHEAAEFKLGLGRHIATRDQAVKDFEVLCKVKDAGHSITASKLQSLIETETESITILRRLLADKEVQEGRLHKAARLLLGKMLEDTIFFSNERNR